MTKIIRKRTVNREEKIQRRREIRQRRREEQLSKLADERLQKRSQIFENNPPKPPKTKPTIAPPKKPAPPPPQPPPDAAQYPTIYLPLENMDYRWAAPIFDPPKQKRLLSRFTTQESVLRNAKTSTSNSVETRMHEVYRSIKETGLINPLIVKQHHYGTDFDILKDQLYVVIGNQRLCCLRILKEELPPEEFNKLVNHKEGMIPCRISKEADNWTDNSEAYRAKPYEFIEGYKHNRTR